MKVILLHEWLTNLAGSEKVVGAMRRAFAGAPLQTTMRWGAPFDGWDDVDTTWLQRLASGPSSHIRALPLMPAAWRSTPLPAADVYVTSFHTFALHARVPRGAPHLVYCHTPPRFIWSREQLRGDGGWHLDAALAVGARALARGDRRRAGVPTAFVANSTAVAARIERVYGRNAEVVHPPVEVGRFASALGTPKAEHYVFFSRLVAYKRPSLAVDAFGALGIPLVVAGEGRARDELERRAPPNVRFVGRVEDRELPTLLAGARGLVYPGEEDFGIVPVEAMAAGTPVIALGRGGVLDTVQDGRSGILFTEPTVEALVTAVRRAERTTWDADAISASTARFDEPRFAREITDRVAALVR